MSPSSSPPRAAASASPRSRSRSSTPPSRTAQSRQGTSLRLRASVDQHRPFTPQGLWQATTSTGRQRTPPPASSSPSPSSKPQRLLLTLPEADPARTTLLPHLAHFRHAPITTLHLWFDREIVLSGGKPLDHAALLDTRIQWVFNKSRIRRDEPAPPEHHIELTISASFPELAEIRETLLASALAELALFFPAVHEARLLRSGVLKEVRATFSVTPGLDAHRPPAATAAPGLFLAGDWTRTGWPSTMEGAVRSGRLAAEAVMPAQKFLTPDLPATGLMRLLARR